MSCVNDIHPISFPPPIFQELEEEVKTSFSNVLEEHDKQMIHLLDQMKHLNGLSDEARLQFSELGCVLTASRPGSTIPHIG